MTLAREQGEVAASRSKSPCSRTAKNKQNVWTATYAVPPERVGGRQTLDVAVPSVNRFEAGLASGVSDTTVRRTAVHTTLPFVSSRGA